MKIQVNQLITDFDGNPIAEGFTIKSAMVQALMATMTGDESMSGKQKVEAFMTASKVYAANDFVDLSVEELSMIKDRSGRLFSAIVVGRLWPVLDQSGH